MNHLSKNTISTNEKLIALLSYATFIGLLIAYFLNKDNKSAFVTWHIKNMFGLMIFLLTSVVSQEYWFGIYIYYFAFICWVVSIIMCVFNKTQAVPWVSKKFQQWFTFLN